MLLSPSTGSANFAEAVELSGYLGSAQPWGKTVAAHAEQATRGWRFVTWAGSSAAAEPTAYAKFAEPVEAIKKGTCPGTCVPFRRHLRATALEH